MKSVPLPDSGRMECSGPILLVRSPTNALVLFPFPFSLPRPSVTNEQHIIAVPSTNNEEIAYQQNMGTLDFPTYTRRIPWALAQLITSFSLLTHSILIPFAQHFCQ